MIKLTRFHQSNQPIAKIPPQTQKGNISSEIKRGARLETYNSPFEEPKGRLNWESGYKSSRILFIPNTRKKKKKNTHTHTHKEQTRSSHQKYKQRHNHKKSGKTQMTKSPEKLTLQFPSCLLQYIQHRGISRSQAQEKEKEKKKNTKSTRLWSL